MSEDLREVSDEAALEEARGAELAILFKHSTKCSISRGAKSEVDRFLEAGRDVPIYVLDVINNRALSLKAAEVLGVKHESPQAILLRSGEVVAHASHRHVTAQLLEGWLTAPV